MIDMACIYAVSIVFMKLVKKREKERERDRNGNLKKIGDT